MRNFTLLELRKLKEGLLANGEMTTLATADIEVLLTMAVRGLALEYNLKNLGLTIKQILHGVNPPVIEVEDVKKEIEPTNG